MGELTAPPSLVPGTAVLPAGAVSALCPPMVLQAAGLQQPPPARRAACWQGGLLQHLAAGLPGSFWPSKGGWLACRCSSSELVIMSSHMHSELGALPREVDQGARARPSLAHRRWWTASSDARAAAPIQGAPVQRSGLAGRWDGGLACRPQPRRPHWLPSSHALRWTAASRSWAPCGSLQSA